MVDEQLLLLMKEYLSVESFVSVRHLIGSIDPGIAKQSVPSLVTEGILS